MTHLWACLAPGNFISERPELVNLVLGDQVLWTEYLATSGL